MILHEAGKGEAMENEKVGSEVEREDQAVLVQKRNGVCRLALNRPKAMNALNLAIIRQLHQVFSTLWTEEEIRVVVLEGKGGNFSSGADMADLEKGWSAPEYLNVMRDLSRLVQTIREVPQPVISKVKGAAVGLGANLALSADFVVSDHKALFWQVFVNIGLGLDGGGTYVLPRLVGIAKAKELALLGERLDGKTAESIGLIYRSVPEKDLDLEVEALIEKLLQRSPRALELIKAGLEGSFDMSLKEALEWEAAHQSILFQTEEHKEAVRWFMEARKK